MKVARVGDSFSGVVALPNPKASSGYTPTMIVGRFISSYEPNIKVGEGGIPIITTTSQAEPTGLYTNPHTGEQVPAWVPTSITVTVVGRSKSAVGGDTVESPYVGSLVVDNPSCANVDIR
jgi:hypothetical protein